MLKPLSQIFDDFRLSPEESKIVLEYVRLSITSNMTTQSSDRIAAILKLIGQRADSVAILHEIDTWCLHVANQTGVNLLESCEDSLEEIVWLYALLSSQPTLSERAADQIGQILDLATSNETLALLLNEIDRLILESTDLLSDEAQHQYANQAARILEFLAPSPNSENSEQLLSMLSDQCAEIAAIDAPGVTLSDAERADVQSSSRDRSNQDVGSMHAPCKADTLSRWRFKAAPQWYVLTALCIASAAIASIVSMVGEHLASTPSVSDSAPIQLQTKPSRFNNDSNPVQTVPIVNRTVNRTTKMSAAETGGIVSLSASQPKETAKTVNVIQQMVEHQQSKFEQAQTKSELQQFRFELQQSRFEQAQQQAEYYQMLAESQHQYEEAQRWHEEAQRNLRLSKEMKAQAQVELQSAQERLRDTQRFLLQRKQASTLSHPQRQPKLDHVLVQSWFVIASFFGWFLVAVTSTMLLLTCVEMRKREFG